MKSFSLKALSLAGLMITLSATPTMVAKDKKETKKEEISFSLEVSPQNAYKLGKKLVLPAVALYLFYKHVSGAGEYFGETNEAGKKIKTPAQKATDKYIDIIAGIFIFDQIKPIYNAIKGKLNSGFTQVEQAVGLA